MRTRCVALIALVGLMVSSCEVRENYNSISINDLRKMQRFDASIKEVILRDVGGNGGIDFVAILLKTQKGERYAIHPVNISSNLIAFARTLKEGASYEFPGVLLEYEEKHGALTPSAD